MDAISGQESGGDYGAENPYSGAYGRFQIMPANWPSWSAEAGIPGAPQTAQNQDRVARYKMQQYYNMTGDWGKVARMWYAGEGSLGYSDEALNRPQADGHPSINQYVNQVLGRLGAAPSGGATNGRASTTSGITGGGSGGNTYGIYNNLNSGSGNNSGRNLLTSGGIFGGIGDIISSAGRSLVGGGGVNTTPQVSETIVDQYMRIYGITRDQALRMLGATGNANDTDHFFDIPPGDQRDFDESVFRDRRDFEYNAGQDAMDREILDAEIKAKAAQQQFDNAMAVGDFQAAQKAAEDRNHWEQVAAQQAQDRINLEGQGQQLDYNLGLGNIAADRYRTDADLALGNARIASDTALGQQRNQTAQFDAETARLNSERDYLLGMANATTDAERAATEERRRQDMVAIANMEGRNQFILGQQGNQVDAFNADTSRQSSMQNYYAALANAANDAARIGIEDLSRLDRNSQFNADQKNQFTLGQQSNQTNQFGMETDRANRMGQLALENNKFIAELANSPRDMFTLYAMQRGVAPDWGTIMAGGTPAQGAALAPADVMNAYTPVTAATTFGAEAAQSQAAQNQNSGYNADSNYFLKNFRDANTATSTLPQFNEQFQAAQGQAGSDYDSSKNPFIGAQPSYQPGTSAPSFNYQAPQASAGQWTGPEAISDFIQPKTDPVAGVKPTYTDTNIGGLQNGVALSGLKPGLNYSTVGGGDRTGSSFSIPAFYDQGMTQRIGPDDVVQGGTGVWTWYGDNLPGGGQPLIKPYNPADAPRLAEGGLTRAQQFITGDDPFSPDGLGENAEMNEPVVAPNGQYLGTRVTPLNPARRPMGKAWNDDTVRMAAGFGLRPANFFAGKR